MVARCQGVRKSELPASKLVYNHTFLSFAFTPSRDKGLGNGFKALDVGIDGHAS